MPFEITMPQLGLTMETGTVVEWLVSEGDPFGKGQELFQVETDKSVVVVEARQEGVLARTVVAAGQRVAVGTVLAVAVVPGETLPAGWSPEQSVAAHVTEKPVATIFPPSKAQPASSGGIHASWKARAMAMAAGLDLRSVAASGPSGRIIAADVARATGPDKATTLAPAHKVTPVAAKLATALGLDSSLIAGSGREGEITQADVLSAAAGIIRGTDTAPRPAREDAKPVAIAGLPQAAETVALRGVRKIVSEGMAASSHATARVTLFREVDATDLVRLRGRFRAMDINVAYNDILVYICATALREHPGANARLGDGQIEYPDCVNVGLAVDTDRGLLVPVIHDAQSLTLSQTAAERVRLIEAARTGRILPDDLTGGTFTITNLGMYGVEGFTPIINLPECCILGVGKIVRKPVAVDQGDTMAVRQMMTLSLVFDHRVIDGAPAARFLDRIAQLVESPLLLLG